MISSYLHCTKFIHNWTAKAKTTKILQLPKIHIRSNYRCKDARTSLLPYQAFTSAIRALFHSKIVIHKWSILRLTSDCFLNISVILATGALQGIVLLKKITCPTYFNYTDV